MTSKSRKLPRLKQLSIDRFLTKQPTPKSWFDLPFEMREMVIDRMDSQTRCRFAECSTLCEKEAKTSKNYFHRISVPDNETDKRIRLEVSHTAGQIDYELNFLHAGTDQTIVVFETFVDWNEHKRLVQWTKVEWGNAMEVRLRYYKEFIEKYQNSIKIITILDNTFPFSDHSLMPLKFLKEIGIPNDDVIKSGYLSLHQVLHGEVVFLENTKLTFEEIIEFKGLYLTIKSDDFDVQCLMKYLKMWKNGELVKNMEVFVVYTEKPCDADLLELIKGLDVFEFEKDEHRTMFRFYANHHIEKECYTEVVCCSHAFVIAIDEKFRTSYSG